MVSIIFEEVSMITQIVTAIGAIFILLLAGMLFQGQYRLIRKNSDDRPVSMVDYLYKISRITGKSEYDIFCKSAEYWPISSKKIELDFQRYLSHQITPYYVNDFVRKNKKHIDELHIPRF